MSAVRAIGLALAPRRPRWHERVARQISAAALGSIREGRLVLRDAEGAQAFGSPSTPVRAMAALDATVQVADPSFYVDLLLGGSVGAGSAYAKGKWSSSDTTALCRLLLRNREALHTADGPWTALTAAVRRMVYRGRRNTKRGSRRNIEAHYDLGNDFFSLLLDPTLSYSAAKFDRPNMSLEEASLAKLDSILALLELPPDARVLEIGTGWGGFALRAAGNGELDVTTTTISPRQAALARERLDEAGLAERARVLELDYRDLDGLYDGLVSIEMIEAVGAEYYDDYFRLCAARLRSGAPFALQAIVIEDDAFDAARRDVDFIKWHIFPGSCIPSRAVLVAAAERAGFTTETEVDLTASYGETLRRWRANLHANRARIQALGFDDAFIRLWDFYFCYSEAGFEERHTRDLQIRFRKKGGRVE